MAMGDAVVTAERVGAAFVLRPSRAGDLTAAEATAFRADAEAALVDARHAVVDLAPLSFIDSSGLAALVSLHRALAGRGGELRLAAPGRDVRAVIELARLHRLFEIYDTVAEAVEGLAGT